MVAKVLHKPFGLMFHHFHGGEHAAGQGSITAEQFEDILRFAGLDNILTPAEWIARAKGGALRERDTCITFDDALRCQFDIALPVLRDLNLKAFWFIYSSVFEGTLERLEIYRYFRGDAFTDINDFYAAFDTALGRSRHADAADNAMVDFDPKTYLRQFPFYTECDRRFRFIRDKVLGETAYYEVMDAMVAPWLKRKGDIASHLWMDDPALSILLEEGHEIGLHSYSHPTRMEDLDREAQWAEYERNRQHLLAQHQLSPTTMSHPCNSHNDVTLDLLNHMGVDIGFCSNRGPVPNRSLLQMPREDHANILAMMANGESSLHG